jgi:hypothetical protein
VFDITSDPALEMSRTLRELEARALKKIAALNTGKFDFTEAERHDAPAR